MVLIFLTPVARKWEMKIIETVSWGHQRLSDWMIANSCDFMIRVTIFLKLFVLCPISYVICRQLRTLWGIGALLRIVETCKTGHQGPNAAGLPSISAFLCNHMCLISKTCYDEEYYNFMLFSLRSLVLYAAILMRTEDHMELHPAPITMGKSTLKELPS